LKIYKLQELTLSELCWVWAAYWRLWYVWCRIKLKQGGWLRSKLRPSTDIVNGVDPAAVTKAERMHELVRLASRLHWVSQACLPRSIVLIDLLRTIGITAVFKLGVSKKNAQFASHAWVEVDSVMISEPGNVKNEFTELTTLSEDSSSQE
jgi:hypothetical protein